MEPQFFFAKVKSINVETRSVEAVASTPDLDRDNERILPSAFAKHIDSFRANPVVLAAHKHRLDSGHSPVIGSVNPDSILLNTKEVPFSMNFAETELGEEYWKLYRDKHMRAFSIGFVPLEWKDDRDPQLGSIRTYTNIELLEISAVPVPSNRAALARMKGFYDAEDTKDAMAKAVADTIEGIKQYFEQQLEDIKSLIIANPDGLAEHFLGGDSELSNRGGAEQKMSEHLTRIQNACRKVD